VRHATRYALPAGTDLKAWLLSGGSKPPADTARGLRRARAATLLALALPGSTYLYQGEELGLPEVADLPADELQDPTWVRSEGTEKGRDGCRVPLPWTATGPSFGFGPGPAHLPQPAGFAELSVERQDADGTSTLSLYRRALAERRRLQSSEALEWHAEGPDDVVRFSRPGGWTCVTNFGEAPAPLPAGRVILSSGPVGGGLLPSDTTAWLEPSSRSTSTGALPFTHRAGRGGPGACIRPA
jgi:alpha-glucosidase